MENNNTISMEQYKSQKSFYTITIVILVAIICIQFGALSILGHQIDTMSDHLEDLIVEVESVSNPGM